MSHHYDICDNCGKTHITIKREQQCNAIYSKKHKYKTAFVKGLNRCCVGLRQYNEQTGMFLCLMPFGNERWIPESELTDFCL